MWGKKKKIQAEIEWLRHQHEKEKENGYLQLTLLEDAGYRYKLDRGEHFVMDYINGYTYDLILADILYNLLKHEICLAIWKVKEFSLITKYKEKYINEVYPPKILIRSSEDGQVIAFNPIRKDLIAEEVAERCWGHGDVATITFHALLRTPEEISRWPRTQLERLSEPENCKFRIFADENWEHTVFEINPKFFSKQDLIHNINETLADYNIKLKVSE